MTTKAEVIMARTVSIPIPPVRVAVGRDLVAWRRSLGVSRRQLAAKLGLPARYLSSIEKGREMPTTAMLARIVAMLEALSLPASTPALPPRQPPLKP